MNLVELQRNEFIDFSKNFPYSLFFQSPYWIEIKKENGWDGKIIGLKDKNEIVAATILLTKNIKFINKKIAYAPRGFLIDYNDEKLLDEFVEKLKAYLKEHKTIFLKINPYVKYQERNIDGVVTSDFKNDSIVEKLKSIGFRHQGFYVNSDDKKDIEPRWLSVLNIENKTEEELFKNMRTTTRWSIKNSEKNCLKIIECDRNNLKDFKALMKHTSERRKFIDRPLSYYEKIYDVLAKEKLVKILLVEINFKKLLDKTKIEYNELIDKIKKIKDNPKKQKEIKELSSQSKSFEKRISDLNKYKNEYGNTKIIAGGLYMLYGKQLVYLLGASYKEFMKYNSQYLLQWEMIKFAKKNNYQTFNFYGIDGNFNKESEYYGLFDFKRGFNAEVVELIGEFDLIIDKFAYIMYKYIFKLYHRFKKIKSKL